jgi:hypothetical protein
MNTHLPDASRKNKSNARNVRLYKNSLLTIILAAAVLAFVAASLPLTAAPPSQGRVMWLDASALQLADGASVSQWPDLSGAGNHAVQQDPERTPQFIADGTPFGSPVVRFPGTSPFRHLVVEQMGPHYPPNTIFLVWKINQNTGGDQQALDGIEASERIRIGYQANPGRVFAWSGGGFPNLEKSMAVPFDNMIMTTVVYDPSGGLLRINGVLEHENPTGDLPITGFTIGRRVTDEQRLAGDIAELIVYDRRLSEAEIATVEAYLDAKWLRDPGDTTPPTVPQNLAAYAGAIFTQLSWSPSTDESGQVVYQVERNGQVIASSVSGTRYVDRTVAPTTTYTYAVRAADLSGNLSAPSSSVQATTKGLVQTTGAAKAEFYTGIPGTAVQNLIDSPKFPDNPDAIMILPAVQTPEGWGDTYGVRVTGWFLPPQTGNYVFFLASDDEGQFRLSTDDSPANLKRIAHEPQWNPFRSWATTDRRPFWENRSDFYWNTEWLVPDPTAGGALITLQQGQRYFFEALMKEGGGGDHLGVTFKLDTEPDPETGTPSRMTGNVIESVGDPEFIPPVIATQPRARLAAIGQSVSLNVGVEAVSPAPLFYQWFKNGEEIPGATAATYTIASFQEADEGTYHVVVSNAAGSVTSQSAFVREAGEQTLVTQGLVLRLDASALNLADGAPVDVWPDLSGSGNNAVQVDPAATPTYVAEGSTYGKPVVRFSAESPYPHLLVPDTGPYGPPNTIFLVFKITRSTGADQNALDGLRDGERVRIGYAGQLTAFAGGSFPNLAKPMPLPFPDFILTTVVFDPAGGLLRVNGVLEQENATGNLPITGFTIGRRLTEAQPLAGDIAELLVYNRHLTDEEISQVEAYLQVKWFADPDEEPPPPTVTLNATVANGSLVLAWPASAQGFTLQQTGSLTPPITWAPVAGQVVVQNGNNTVTVPITGQAQFFRLTR